MASVTPSNSATIPSFHTKPISKSLTLSPISVNFPIKKFRFCALRIGLDDSGADWLRKPIVSLPTNDDGDGRGMKGGDGNTWVDWEDKILEDTVPLVDFVKMILHSGKYESGDRLSPEHERTILEKLLPHHPECEKKIGSGVDYITIGYHPNFESSRCLFIVRKDRELVDFSYWKCINGLIRKNYPLNAESFILRHFRRRRRSD